MQRLFSLLLLRSVFLFALAALLLRPHSAYGDPIDITTSAVSQFTLNPSADTLQLNGLTTAFDPSSGAPFIFQTGTFGIGDSGWLVQDVPFSFQEQITIGGVTQLVTFSGDDNITPATDILTIYGTGPVAFGEYTFALQPFTIQDGNVGDMDTVNLEAAVTPEPGAFLLVGTGLAGWGIAVVRKARSSRSASGPPELSA